MEIMKNTLQGASRTSIVSRTGGMAGSLPKPQVGALSSRFYETMQPSLGDDGGFVQPMSQRAM